MSNRQTLMTVTYYIQGCRIFSSEENDITRLFLQTNLIEVLSNFSENIIIKWVEIIYMMLKDSFILQYKHTCQTVVLLNISLPPHSATSSVWMQRFNTC